MAAVKLVLIAAWPTLLAVTHAAAGWLRGGARHRADDPDAVVRLALLALTGSWLGWYVVLSVGWSRYLLPPVFLSGVFVSAFLWELTSGYDLSGTIKRAAQALCKPSLKREGLRALLAVSLVVWSVALTAYYLPGSLSGTQDVGVSEAAAFLNARVAPDELIECYSSELLFLLDRPYHYPPDLVNVQMILWYSWREDVSIDYDPLSADPDYLVMCRQPAGWGTAPLLTTAELYDEVLLTGEFRLLRTFGPYEVYQRAR